MSTTITGSSMKRKWSFTASFSTMTNLSPRTTIFPLPKSPVNRNFIRRAPLRRVSTIFLPSQKSYVFSPILSPRPVRSRHGSLPAWRFPKCVRRRDCSLSPVLPLGSDRVLHLVLHLVLNRVLHRAQAPGSSRNGRSRLLLQTLLRSSHRQLRRLRCRRSALVSNLPGDLLPSFSIRLLHRHYQQCRLCQSLRNRNRNLSLNLRISP